MNQEKKPGLRVDDCPTIELRSWWWKRFIPHYRRQSQLMNDLLKYEWEHGCREAHYNRLKSLLFYGK